MALISLTTNGDGWQGTFALAVESLAEDLLNDGEPVDDVSVDTRDDGHVEGTLTAVEDGHLVIGGRRIDVPENVTGFHVA